MGAIETLLHSKREDILRVAAWHGASNVRVFGSVARGEADEDSDVDFLVDMDAERTLMDRGLLLLDPRDLLGRPVDVVTEKSLYWLLRPQVLKEANPL
jgi:predicted nucleotidyltransferase